MSFPVFDWITDPASWVALITLTVLEIVLGIDNVIFISLLVQRLGHRAQASGLYALWPRLLVARYCAVRGRRIFDLEGRSGIAQIG
jgi:hypothetical protein